MNRAGMRALRPKSVGPALALAGPILCLLLGAAIETGRASLPFRQQTPRRVSLTLVATTDLHGHIFPEDDFTGRPANWGLAKIATLVGAIRGQHPNVLLLDCGDTTQGTPLAYYAVRRMPSRPNPMIAAMNELDYAAMALGNHDFNFGLNVLTKLRREAKFPLLAANLRPTAGSNPAGIEPYAVRTIAGVRVGIAGFVTPGVAFWELPENYAGYEFEGIVHAAQRVIPEVRAKSDLVVVIMHSGLTRDPSSGEPLTEDRIAGENAVGALAATVPGIDVILYGHTHLELSGKSINGVLLAQAKNWGQSLAEADVEMEQKAEGAWRVVAKSSRTIPVTENVAVDQKIAALAQPYQQATQAWLGKVVAHSTAELNTETARIEANPLVALLQRAQMHAAGAEVSLAAAFSTGVHIPAGAVTVRQLCALYPYENTLFTVEMTGAQLREALEHAASLYPAWPWKASDRVRLPGYDADAAEGVEYAMDLSRPAGQRIRGLSYKGKPLDPAQKLNVAINHYRYYGGGGYSVFHGLHIVRRAAAIRQILIDYVTNQEPEIGADTTANWRIEPREAYEALRAEALRSRGAY